MTRLFGDAGHGVNCHASFVGIFGGDKVQLSTIVKQAGSEFPIYDGLAPVLGTNPSPERIWIEEGGARGVPLLDYGAGGAGEEGLVLTFAASNADLFL